MTRAALRGAAWIAWKAGQQRGVRGYHLSRASMAPASTRGHGALPGCCLWQGPGTCRKKVHVVGDGFPELVTSTTYFREGLPAGDLSLQGGRQTAVLCCRTCSAYPDQWWAGRPGVPCGCLADGSLGRRSSACPDVARAIWAHQRSKCQPLAGSQPPLGMSLLSA